MKNLDINDFANRDALILALRSVADALEGVETGRRDELHDEAMAALEIAGLPGDEDEGWGIPPLLSDYWSKANPQEVLGSALAFLLSAATGYATPGRVVPLPGPYVDQHDLRG